MSQDKTEKMEYFISLLDDYIDGKLGEGQTAEIEQGLKEDPFLIEVLKQHVQARANIRVAGEDELRNKFANSFEPIPDVAEPKSNILKILIPIILLLGLAAAAYFYFSGQQHEPEQRPMTASVAESPEKMLLASVDDPSYDLLRSESDTLAASSWQEAVQAFVTKDYKEAIVILSGLSQDSSFVKNHLGKFSLMKGVSNLKLEQFAEAEQSLFKIEADNPYYDQAEWYLALTYFYAGDKAKAKLHMEQISNNSAHYKRSQVKTYLDKLGE